MTLPPPPSGRFDASDKNLLVVVLDKKGHAYIDGKKLTHGQLRERFEQRAAGPLKNAGVMIKAPVGCKHKFVSQVSTLVGKSGCEGRLFVGVVDE